MGNSDDKSLQMWLTMKADLTQDTGMELLDSSHLLSHLIIMNQLIMQINSGDLKAGSCPHTGWFQAGGSACWRRRPAISSSEQHPCALTASLHHRPCPDSCHQPGGRCKTRCPRGEWWDWDGAHKKWSGPHFGDGEQRQRRHPQWEGELPSSSTGHGRWEATTFMIWKTSNTALPSQWLMHF